MIQNDKNVTLLETLTAILATAPTTDGGGPYVYPQPGIRGDVKVAVPFAGPGHAILRVRGVRGALVKIQLAAATTAGIRHILLDCDGLDAGLYWLTVEMKDRDEESPPWPPVRFVLLER